MYLGIDLGTSNSAIAGNSNSEIKIYKTADGADVLPSVIYIDKRGHRLFGKRAYEQTLVSPDNVARGFKRLMGTASKIDFVASEQSMTPEECSAEILRQLVSQAVSESGGQEISGTAITIPAAFNQMQSEATLRAAQEAGLEKVVLLQEPIAAAMAAMSQIKNRSGQFVVYDLGGGTFDLALVQSLSGTVNIIGHEGINMLGGQDFDRMIINSVVRPWLLENFQLPADFQKDERYKRLLGKASIAVEAAKIELSTNDSATIFRSDEDLQIQDEKGADIYLEIGLSREALDDLIEPSLNQTIELTRKIIKDNGYSNQDIDRIVFVGGPSKMPWIREKVPMQLGIAAEMAIDPMTAVAVGAAIYAESREWSETKTSRKATRASAKTREDVGIKFDYVQRTSEEQVKLRIKADTTAVAGHYTLQVDNANSGWTSGRATVAAELVIDLPVSAMGDNKFNISIFDGLGHPITDAQTEIVIVKSHATAAAIPTTQTIAVKVRAGATRLKNVLEPLILKGTPLPASGSKTLQAAYGLGRNLPGRIDLDLYQDEGAADPELNLAIGSFQVSDTDLPEGLSIREGDPIIFHWSMDDSGLLTANVELPSVQQTFNTRRFYVDQAGHQSFDGETGERLVESAIATAEDEVATIVQAVGVAVQGDIAEIEDQLEDERKVLRSANSGDERRAITERIRRVRQKAAQVRSRPDFRGRYLEHQLAEIVNLFNHYLRAKTTPEIAARFDQEAGAAANELRRRTPSAFDAAEVLIDQISAIYYQTMWQRPEFVTQMFRSTASDRHLSVDKAAFDLLVADGENAIKAGDYDELRMICSRMWGSQVRSADIKGDIGKLASVLRG